MKKPEDKKGEPQAKPGVTPGQKEKRVEGGRDPGTITEVAPEAVRRGIGPIKEMAPNVGKIRPEVAPDLRVRRPGPIQEMAPEPGRGIHPEIAPEIGRGSVHILYAATIHGAIAEGNLSEMRGLLTRAEHQLSQWGDLRSTLEILKVEIAKLEHKQRKG